MTTVFLSYSHDSDRHKGMVHGLADRLATEVGLDVLIDRDVGPGGPDEGWPAWSVNQVTDADRVLIAISPEYAYRYRGLDDDTDRGKGTVAEARAINQSLYDSRGVNRRFRVVLFAPQDEGSIPQQLRAYHWFNAALEDDYQALVAWLKGAEVEAPGEDTPAGPVWSEPDLTHVLPVADRRPDFAIVRDALAGQTSERIFLFEGPSSSGKTYFLNEIINYADKVGLPWTRFDFKGAQPIESFYLKVILELKELLPRTSASDSEAPLRELADDLGELETPVLFVLDTFEKATEDASHWVSSMFLPQVRKLPGVVVVVAGQRVPDESQYPWRTLAEHRKLGPIREVDDWDDYQQRVHERVLLPRNELNALIQGTRGNVGSMRQMLDNIAEQRPVERQQD